MNVDGESLQRFFKANKFTFRKCLEPRMVCPKKPIRAHSVQNSRTFDFLANDGHVIAIEPRFTKDGPELDFKRVGRNEASTFTGLCNQHDTEIFAPIETRALDLSDIEQLFLFAYRSITRELHVVMEGAIKLQTEYNSRVERGLDSPDEMSPASLLATQHLVKAFQTYQYRAEHFDRALLAKDYTSIEHDVIVLEGQNPCIAVSSLFSLDEMHNWNDVVRVCLNVFPMNSDETAAILAYSNPDAGFARAALDRVLRSAGEHRKYELSKVVVGSIENFFVSPAHFEKWPADKVDLTSVSDS